MAIWTLARKDFRVVWRDRRALIVLLLMPLLMIAVLGLSLGEGFGQKPDDRLRIAILDLDKGYTEHDPDTGRDIEHHWSRVVLDDLARTSGIRIDPIGSREEANELIENGRRAAVWIFEPNFSELLTKCSFMPGGVNPMNRDGIDLAAIDSKLLRDPTQLTAASIIAQVAQVTTLRVVLPWMIGRAFEQVGRQMGGVVKFGLAKMFPSYDLTATTWASLTRNAPRSETRPPTATDEPRQGTGWLGRGGARYQILVPAYLVIFAYFLVLTVGRLFVSERQQGTMKPPASRAAVAVPNPGGKILAGVSGVDLARSVPAAGGPVGVWNELGSAAALARAAGADDFALRDGLGSDRRGGWPAPNRKSPSTARS